MNFSVSQLFDNIFIDNEELCIRHDEEEYNICNLISFASQSILNQFNNTPENTIEDDGTDNSKNNQNCYKYIKYSTDNDKCIKYFNWLCNINVI